MFGAAVGLSPVLAAPQPVAHLQQFSGLWSRVEFEFQSKPATVIRVPKPSRKTSRTLEVSADFFLSSYLRECPHNGCEARHVDADPGRVFCFCHGSRFWAKDGSLEAGIANEDLQTLRLEVAQRWVWVLGLE